MPMLRGVCARRLSGSSTRSLIWVAGVMGACGVGSGLDMACVILHILCGVSSADSMLCKEVRAVTEAVKMVESVGDGREARPRAVISGAAGRDRLMSPRAVAGQR